MRRAKKLIALLLCLIMALGTSGAFASEFSPKAAQEAVSGELIVSIQGSTTYSMLNANQVSHESAIENKGFFIKDALFGSNQNIFSANASTQDKQDALTTMGHVYLVGYDKFKSFDAAKEDLSIQLQNKGLKVKYIEPNYTLRAFGIHAQQEWHYNMIKVQEAWQTTPGSSAVKIAVLDTGIEANHQSLANLVNTSLGKNFTSGSATDTTDRQGHGTHCAGTIASYGSVSGVMQSATLIPVKVLGDDCTGSTYGIQQGILYASEIGADVISMSLGGGSYSQSMQDACTTAINRGTVIVAATGNDGVGTVSYPAKYSGVIGVGSVTSSRLDQAFLTTALA